MHGTCITTHIKYQSISSAIFFTSSRSKLLDAQWHFCSNGVPVVPIADLEGSKSVASFKSLDAPDKDTEADEVLVQ